MNRKHEGFVSKIVGVCNGSFARKITLYFFSIVKIVTMVLFQTLYYTFARNPLCNLTNSRIHFTMDSTRPQPKRRTSAPKPGISSLINAANTNDRFSLLEDSNVLPGNLDNYIHAIFHQFDATGPLKQALRLASHLIQHDSVLAFFVPLLYGSELTDTRTGKLYLSDPLAIASSLKRQKMINGVRTALQSLAHRLDFKFIEHEDQVYARTLADHSRPCSHGPAFQGCVSANIEMTDRFNTYYHSVTGYAAASRCAQFRHDFLFAITLVHEIVHAFGVLRRGNLREPFYRLDCPETEWGYAWEHFMFGSIINPQDRSRAGTHILMRKVWSSAKAANAVGGKEYCNVGMSYIAQWFRNDTWEIIEKQGPTGISASTTNFKIQVSKKHAAWVVTSDCAAVREDVRILHRQWVRSAAQNSVDGAFPDGQTQSHKVLWRFVSPQELQESNVVPPMRESRMIEDYSPFSATLPSIDQFIPMHNSVISSTSPQQSVIAVFRASTPSGGRKRKLKGPTDEGRAPKQKKRGT